jgi:hypothetical protein
VLRAPSTVQAGKPFQVTVTAYDDSGKHKPAEGVTVTGASGPTGPNGKATVNLSEAATLRARHGSDIPSAPAVVCVRGRGVSQCP